MWNKKVNINTSAGADADGINNEELNESEENNASPPHKKQRT